MVSKAELLLVENLRKVLDPLPIGAAVEDSETMHLALVGLEFYLPEVIGEIHPDCPELDGFSVAIKEKVGPDEIVICGSSWIFIRVRGRLGNALVPFHVRLQISPTANTVTWLECRLGEREDDQLKHGSEWSVKKLAILSERAKDPDFIDDTNWFYKVTFGERRIQ